MTKGEEKGQAERGRFFEAKVWDSFFKNGGPECGSHSEFKEDVGPSDLSSQIPRQWLFELGDSGLNITPSNSFPFPEPDLDFPYEIADWKLSLSYEKTLGTFYFNPLRINFSCDKKKTKNIWSSGVYFYVQMKSQIFKTIKNVQVIGLTSSELC